ncbi:MAG TPA: TonB-dependent receptor [Vicinamibacterales bacterium]
MTNISTIRLRLLLTAFVLVMGATPAAAQTAGRYAGRSLADVLRDLQSRGLKVVFSSEVVRPEMRVASEPKSTAPRKILDEVLEPHGLRAAAGPKETWLVMRARQAAATAVSATVGAQAPAPVTVAGQVVTGAKKAPVVGAVVEAGAPRVVTDPAGRFAIDAPPGPLHLQVTAKGFVTQHVDLTVVAGIPAIEIVLQVSPEFRETVTVSVLGQEVAPASPQIVVAPAAVQRAAGAGDNVFHALQTLPGVSATEDWGSRLSVRGGGPDQNLTVMDGVEIHNPYRLFGITSAFNPEIVDRFELTAGGFGAKYGDRLSSILLVDNRQGTTTRRLAWSATSSFTDSNVVLEGKLPGGASGSWLVTGRRTYYDLIAERIADLDFPDFQDVQGKGVWDPKPGHRLTLFVLRSRESADTTNDNPDSSEVAVLKTTRNDVAALSYSAPVGARASSRTLAAWYHYNDAVGAHGGRGLQSDSQRSNTRTPCIQGRTCSRDYADVYGVEVVDFTRDLKVRDVSFRQELGVQAGRRHLFETGFDVHALRTGWGWTVGADMTEDLSRAMRFAVTGDPGPTSPRIGAGLPLLLRSTRDTTRAAVWFQDRYQPRAGVLLEPGLRIDHGGLAGETTASPRLGLRLDLTPRTRLRFAIGRYTQSPGYEKLLQADYFFDLTSADSGQLKSERSVHVIGAIERALTSSVTMRIEAYSKTFDRLIVGRLETEAETAARVAPYNFPAEIATSVPSAPIITTNPVNGATGRAYGFDVYVEKPAQSKLMRDRLSGWASYTFGVANVTNYGRQYPFDYDRRHSVSVVGQYWLSRRLDVGATLRVASGFPTTPAVGIRVVATANADGSLVPLKDVKGLYLWGVDRGDFGNVNTSRLPAYARLDLRVTFNPKKVTGRWQIYVEVFNVLNRKHGRAISYDLRYAPSSDRPRLESRTDGGMPAVPSFGVRYRF